VEGGRLSWVECTDGQCKAPRPVGTVKTVSKQRSIQVKVGSWTEARRDLVKGRLMLQMRLVGGRGGLIERTPGTPAVIGEQIWPCPRRSDLMDQAPCAI
jgi:hypothetical protein